MPEPDYVNQARKMTTKELIIHSAGWKPSSPQKIAYDYELQRRRDSAVSLRSWVAIGISLFSLAVAIIALALRWRGP